MSDPNGDSQAAVQDVDSAVVRFAGDSGDGMQLAGLEFTNTAAVFGNDIATLPDFPAEIRAPAGTVAGVSAFQINFAAEPIHTPGDRVDALIAMNPAAFRAHIDEVEPGGIVVVNSSAFDRTNLRKAGYAEDHNPAHDEAYTSRFRIYEVPITRLNAEALEDSGLGAKEIARCKNMYALGLVYWIYDRPIDETVRHLREYFGEKKNKPEIAEANVAALKAGYFFGETAEIFPGRYRVRRAPVTPGKYRKVSGNEALATGLTVAGRLAGKSVLYCSYPITPASDVLHQMAGMRAHGVKTFQAEDEIAAVCAALGAGFAGEIGVTGTSGPGFTLKQEGLNLAVMAELPLIVVDVQRGGPSTGLPTKTEQADLLQACFGRNGESPVLVMAPRSPSDCFDVALEAARFSLQHRVPAVILGDGHLANGAEPWAIPDADALEPIEVAHATDPEAFEPYARDERLVRPWAVPGTAGLEHRIGGLEKADGSGAVCYEDTNHQRMTALRREKVERIAGRVPPVEPHGERSGDLLVIGWGGTHGAIHTAVERARARGRRVSAAHLRHLNPMPRNLGDLLAGFDRVLVPELNDGQLRLLLRGRFLVDARGLNKIQGKPFLVDEIEQAIELMVRDEWGDAEARRPWRQRVDAASARPVGEGRG